MVLVTVGVTHGELTTLLWGGTFGFVWAYVMASRALVWRQAGVRNPRGTITVLNSDEVVFHADEVPAVPVFFYWTVELSGVHSPGRKFQGSRPMVAQDTPIPLSAPRGRYTVTIRWVLSDIFGFSRLVPPTRWTGILVVEPQAWGQVSLPPPTPQRGTWRPKNRGRRAGDPFDVRPYVPGDDLRRLHWPLFAHSGSPFVRTADPAPPPSGRQFFILDTEAPREEDLDLRLGTLMTWVENLGSQGTPWTVEIPGADLTLTSSNSPGTALAALRPAPLPEGPVPPSWPTTVTLLTGPGSIGAARLARQLASGHRNLETVEIPWAPAALVTKPVWWRRRG